MVVDRKTKQRDLAQALDDLRQWQGASAPLSNDAIALLLQSQRLSFEDFCVRHPGIDPAWVVALWLVRSLRDNLSFDPALIPRVDKLQHWLLNFIAQEKGSALWSDPDWCEALDRLLFHWQTWYPHLGRAGDKFMARADRLLEGLGWQSSQESLAAVHAFNHSCDRDLERAAQLAGRIRDSELGQQKVREAKRQVEESVSEWIAGSRLPDPIFRYLRHVMTSALNYYLINDQHSEWERWTELLQPLCAVFAPNKTPEELALLRRSAPALGARLSATKPPPGCDNMEYHEFVNEAISAIDKLLNGELPDAHIAPPLSRPKGVARLRSHRRDDQAHQLQCGDWVIFSSSQQGELRCQYLLQSPVTDELIFINRQGHKVLQQSVGKYLDARDLGHAAPMADIKVYSTALNQAAARLKYCYAEQSTQRQLRLELEARERESQQRIKAERERTMAARRQADKAARQKAMAEEMARLQALKQAREKAEQEAQYALQQQRWQAALERVDSLREGAWADVIHPDGRRERCSLGMVMPSTQKYLFYDKYQRKVGEWRRDALAQLVLDEAIEFFEVEPGFDSRLEQIVFGQRRAESLGP